MPHDPERPAKGSSSPARATTTVFYEPAGRRWRRVRLTGWLGLVVLAGLAVSVGTLPVLPAPALSTRVEPVSSVEGDHYTVTSLGVGATTRVIRDTPPDDLDPNLPHYTVQRFGPYNKRVVLTFDDGPDRRYTARILDTLSAYHVPAAFFVLGGSVTAGPDLLQRMYREGHEIGNHTFTPPGCSPCRVGGRRLNSTARSA